MRYHKVKFYPNVTGNYTINQDKEHQYLNGYISINFKEPINKVRKMIIYNIFSCSLLNDESIINY